MTTDATPPVRRPRRVGRAQVVTALGAALVLVVCTVGFRLSEATRPYELRNGRLDQPTAYQTGRVVVGSLQLAGQVRDDDQVTTTPGLFVAVVVTVQARGADAVYVDDVQLRAGGRTYLPFSGSFRVEAPSGFESSAAALFEIDPADLAGLAVECSDRGIIYRYYTTVRVPLGISRRAAPERAAVAQGAETTLPEPRRRPLS